MDDLDLINGCLNKDRKSLEFFYRKFAPKMYNVCFYYAKDSFDAEDILQEGFIKALSKLKYFKMESSLYTWLRKIFINTSINFCNKKSKYRIESLEEAYHISDSSDAISKMSENEILDLIEALPIGYKTVFNMRIQGYPHEDIAEVLHISTNTSKTQYMKAKLQLQRRLKCQTKKS